MTETLRPGQVKTDEHGVTRAKFYDGSSWRLQLSVGRGDETPEEVLNGIMELDNHLAQGIANGDFVEMRIPGEDGVHLVISDMVSSRLQKGWEIISRQ